MTKEASELAEDFIEEMEFSGGVAVATEDLGALLISYLVIGGGAEAIIIRVGLAVVRLSLRPDGWHAEELVVRGE